jgi:hypothetical protein
MHNWSEKIVRTVSLNFLITPHSKNQTVSTTLPILI